MAEIELERVGEDEYEVTVTDGGSTTTHTVALQPGDLDDYGHGADAVALIRASFEFLLEREPKEAILSRFQLGVISRYFPDYADRVADYL